jgi:hypothetical protein
LRLLALGVFLAAVVMAATAARADGKMFAVEVADVSGAQIPDQSALICWDPATKMQTLAIETRFVGKGTEFGWVVPLPSRPEVKPGTKGMFPSLRGMFAPVVQTRGLGAAPIVIALIVVVLIFVYAPTWKGAAGLLLVLLFLAMVMLPALGTARAGGSGSPIAEPDFIDRRIVGDFEVTTLESPEGKVVVDWLRSHQFHVPAAAESVIDQYAKEKWSFVATRLVRESDTAEASTAHPLVFTFTTDAPVYPMRLTGADAKRDLSVELFVFGPSRAMAMGLAVQSAGDLVVSEAPRWRAWRRASSTHVHAAHTAITPLVGDAKFATRLTGTLRPSQMTRDVDIAWTRGGATGRSAQTRATAAGIGVDLGLTAMFIVLCIVGHYEKKRNLPRFTALRWGVIAAVCVGVVTFAALPKVTTHSGRDGWRAHRDLVRELEERIRLDLSPVESVPLAAASEALDEVLARRLAAGEPLQARGDEPGQADLRVMDGMVYLVAVSAAGAEQWEGIWRTDEPDTE